MSKKRIGILTSGGDCPGLNAVLRAASRATEKLGWELLGFHDGFEGLLPPHQFTVLNRHATAGIMHLGGTILGTVNKGHFVAKVGAGDKMAVPPAVIEESRQTLARLGVEGLITAGRCISGDHTALASYRIVSHCMAIGEAAGTAAALSVASACTPRELDSKKLRLELADNGANTGATT